MAQKALKVPKFKKIIFLKINNIHIKEFFIHILVLLLRILVLEQSPPLHSFENPGGGTLSGTYTGEGQHFCFLK